jgi:hypothetical protein
MERSEVEGMDMDIEVWIWHRWLKESMRAWCW